IGSLAGAGSVLLDPATLTVGGNNTSTVFSGVISGPGNLTKQGTGTFGLSGANTYTGATMVTGGALQAGAANAFSPASAFTVATGAVLDLNNFNQTIGSLAGGGGVTLGTATLTTGGDNTSTLFSGVISGTGGVTKQGTGAFTLAGANTYSGGTTVTGGTLQLSGNGTLGSAAAATTVSGGFLDLGGTNQTQNGGLTLTAGAVNNGTLTSSGVFALQSGMVGAALAGTGSLSKTTAGTVMQSGASTYTGATSVAAGTLQGGAANAFSPNSAFTVLAGAVLDLNGFNQTIGSLAGTGNVGIGAATLTTGGDNSSTSFSGAFSGTGGLVKQGSGTFTLTGDSSGFTGTANLNAGALVVGTDLAPGAVFGGSVLVGPGTVLSGHGTILGGVANSGTVLPGGSVGTLTIAGNYTQSASGTLAIQLTPAAASKLVVGGAAILGGSSAIGPGSVPSAVVSAGTGGTLDVMPSAGTYPANAVYPILTAGGGVSGKFAQFINEDPALPLTLVYLPNEIDLVLATQTTPTAPTLTTTSIFFGLTRNQQAVAQSLNAVFPFATGDFATLVDAAAALPRTQIPQTIGSFGGNIYANLASVAMQQRRLFLGAMDDRIKLLTGGAAPSATVLGSLSPSAPGWGRGPNSMQLAAIGSAFDDPQYAYGAAPGAAPAWGGGAGPRIWARGYGQFGGIDSNSGALGVNYSTGGGAVGADLVRTPEALLGVAVSAGQSSVGLKTNPENATIDFVEFGAYGARSVGYGAAIDAAAIYAHNDYGVTRGIVLPGFSRTASSRHSGDDEVVDIGLSRPLYYNGWQITPRAGLSYFHIGQGNAAESGAGGIDLAVAPGDFNSLRTRLGATASLPMQWAGGALTPELRAAWTHEFIDDRGNASETFIGSGAPTFLQIGAPVGRDAADLGLGLSLAVEQHALPGSLVAFLTYDATISAHQTANAVAAGLRYTW
ncbi:MAG TPA: autotransporter domain-containing protein, partial [Stellaceae bacterium]|nr:autotransporter domain-containing protein [Stellaceae bacterium]